VGVEHYENFPVASVLCPPALRPWVSAIYHFARTADDLADEGDAPPSQRLSDLAAFRADLTCVYLGAEPSPRWRPVFLGIAGARRTHALPQPLLLALLDAFEQDVRNPAYEHREQLLDYCARSANPIGRLLMHLYDIQDGRSLQQSDAICTALQLINFWQDLSVDLPRGRVYLPQRDLQRHGLDPTQLLADPQGPAARALVRSLCDWARTLMRQGAPLALRVPGRAGWELRLVVQGGLRILEKINAMDFTSACRRPRLSAFDLPVLLWRAARMRIDQGVSP
jgi:hydroxysqualene synthase